MLLKFLGIYCCHLLFISLATSTFLAAVIKWSGEVIDFDASRLDPGHDERGHDTCKPDTAVEFGQFLHCLAWMGTASILLAKQAAPQ